MSYNELSKNHPGGLKDVESTEKRARMYETEDGYKAKCSAFSSIRRKIARL